MLRRFGLALLGFTALQGLVAQEAAPVTTVSASYALTALDASDWTTSQAASLGLSARWGASLVLDGQLRAPFDGSTLTADALLQQLVLTWTLNSWSVVTLGKQRLKWGTARVFSAVDGLEPVYDPLRPRAPLDGVTGIKAEFLPNDWLSLSVLALPAPVLKNSKEAVRADVLWNDADLSAGVIHSRSGDKDRLSVYADAAWFGERLGFYTEAQYKTWRDRDWSWTKGTLSLGLADAETGVFKATVGTQIEVPVWLNGTLRWLTEYHYSGEGFTAAEAGDFAQAWKQRATADAFAAPNVGVATFSRHYGYTGVSGLPLTESLSLEASLLAGLETGFVLARAGLGYAVDQSLWVGLDYTRFDTLPGGTLDSENLLVAQKNQATLTVSTSY